VSVIVSYINRPDKLFPAERGVALPFITLSQQSAHFG